MTCCSVSAEPRTAPRWADRRGTAARPRTSTPRLLAAEPHAAAERRHELRTDAVRQARQGPFFFDLTVSLSKSISVFHASLGENVRLARQAGDVAGEGYWSGLVAEVDAIIWQTVRTGFDYFQREAGYTRTGSHHKRAGGRETGQWHEADLAVAHWLQHTPTMPSHRPERLVIEMEWGVTVYPARAAGDRWRAVWYENGRRRQCESVSEDRLATRLDKVTERLAAGALNLERPGADLIAYYLSPDRLPADNRWSRKHAHTQRRLCERFAAPVIDAVICQDIKPGHMQEIVNAPPTPGEGRRVQGNGLSHGQRGDRGRLPSQPAAG